MEWMGIKYGSVLEEPKSDADVENSSVSNASSDISTPPVNQNTNDINFLLYDVVIWDIRYPDERITALSVPSIIATETMYSVLNDLRNRGFQSASGTTIEATDQEAAQERWKKDCESLMISWDIESQTIMGVIGESKIVPTQIKPNIKLNPEVIDTTVEGAKKLVEDTPPVYASTSTIYAPAVFGSTVYVPSAASSFAYTETEYKESDLRSKIEAKVEDKIITIRETKRKITFEEE